MSKYKNGDVVNYFEGEVWVYGLNQPVNVKSKTCAEFGLEFETQDEFDLNYVKQYEGYFRAGKPCIEMKDDGYRFQWHETTKEKGAMPITSWEYGGRQ